MLVSRRAAACNGTSAKLEAHEALSIRDLLFGAMLPSGNDAATALAEHFGRYCEPEAEETWRPFERAPHDPAHAWERTDPLSRFVAEMNRAAAALGMAQTVCANPHGLVHSRASSCAADVAVLVAAAWTEAAFREAAGAAKHVCEAVAVPLALQAAALASGAGDVRAPAAVATTGLPSAGAAGEAGPVASPAAAAAASDDSSMAAAMMRRPRLQRSPPRASSVPLALSAPPGAETVGAVVAEQQPPLAVMGSAGSGPGVSLAASGAATAVAGGVSAAPPAAATRGPTSHRVVSGRLRGAAATAAPSGPVVRKVSGLGSSRLRAVATPALFHNLPLHFLCCPFPPPPSCRSVGSARTDSSGTASSPLPQQSVQALPPRCRHHHSSCRLTASKRVSPQAPWPAWRCTQQLGRGL